MSTFPMTQPAGVNDATYQKLVDDLETAVDNLETEVDKKITFSIDWSFASSSEFADLDLVGFLYDFLFWDVSAFLIE